MYATAFRRVCAALALTAALGVAAVVPAGAADEVAPTTQLGPTQVLNDPASTSMAVLRDNVGDRVTVRRGDYALGETSQFFTTFYVPRGRVARIFATDPYGAVISGRLQQETASGWHQTNEAVNSADLVVIKYYSTLTSVEPN